MAHTQNSHPVKKKFPIGWIILLILAALVLFWWISMKPSPVLQINGKYLLGENETILSMRDDNEPLANKLVTVCENMPGYDEFLPMSDGKTALTTCMDGWIWKVDLENWTAERFVDAPLEAAGAVLDPLDSNFVYFCSSYLHGESYPMEEHPGVYKLNLTTKEISTVVDRVPLYPYPGLTQDTGVYAFVAPAGEKAARYAEMDDSNSMTCAFCNDLDISRDGKRIYWSEPFNYEGAEMGGGMNIYETISLGEHGRIWCYDLDTDQVSLVVDGLSFADGLLLEYDGAGQQEVSILVCETIKYDIVRAYLAGDKTGAVDIIWRDLPGMCDGMGYDEFGNIWVGLLHARSGIMDTVYAHPWMKQIFLRIPTSMLSGSKGCGLIAFSPDCSECLYYTLYTGENISDIPVAVGCNGKVFLPCFVKTQRGLHYIDNPLGAGERDEHQI